MNWIKSLFLFALFFCAGTLVRGQTNTNFSIVPDLFFKNYYLINAAQHDTTASPEFALGNRSLTGVFSGVSENFLAFNTVLKTSKELNMHGIGLYVHNSNQGEYIQNNRVYGRYAYSARLGMEAVFSMGVQLGFVNYVLKPSIASGGGSDVAPDLGIGVWFWHPDFQVGLSMNQLLNSKLQPITQEYRLNRYYSLTAKTRFALSPFNYAELHGLVSYIPETGLHAQLSPLVVIQNKLEVGTGYQYEKGLLTTLGVREVVLGKGQLKFTVSYLLINTNKVYSFNDAVLEFFLGYGF